MDIFLAECPKSPPRIAQFSPKINSANKIPFPLNFCHSNLHLKHPNRSNCNRSPKYVFKRAQYDLGYDTMIRPQSSMYVPACVSGIIFQQTRKKNHLITLCSITFFLLDFRRNFPMKLTLCSITFFVLNFRRNFPVNLAEIYIQFDFSAPCGFMAKVTRRR